MCLQFIPLQLNLQQEEQIKFVLTKKRFLKRYFSKAHFYKKRALPPFFFQTFAD